MDVTGDDVSETDRASELTPSLSIPVKSRLPVLQSAHIKCCFSLDARSAYLVKSPYKPMISIFTLHQSNTVKTYLERRCTGTSKIPKYLPLPTEFKILTMPG